MQLQTKIMRFMKTGKIAVILMLLVSISSMAQNTVENDSSKTVVQTLNRIKLDGVASVIGKNIVLDSEVDAYKKQLEQQSEGKVEISNCEMLEQIMDRKAPGASCSH